MGWEAGPGGALRMAPQLIAVALLAGCGQADAERRDPFTQTGQLVALSGGDAGAKAACIACHGLRGQGDGRTTPRLAGLPAGYLQKQLEDYAAGLRPDEAMEPIAHALDQGDRQTVAAYYAALPATVQPALEGPDTPAARLYQQGDLVRGLQPCAACHGPAGQGVGSANPPLAGQPAAYVTEQLKLWREGRRRNDPRGLMLQISLRLTPSETAQLGRYVEALASPDPAQEASPEARRPRP